MKLLNFPINHFTQNERILLQFIEENPEQFLKSKPQEVADKTFVSVATLYRLINKLGHSSINNLKIYLQERLREESNYHFDAIDFPILDSDGTYQVTQKLKELYQKTVNETQQLFDPQHLERVAKWMQVAETIDIYTSSANIYFAQNFQFQMQEINKPVQVPQDDYTKRLTAVNSNHKHYAIVISFGGRGSSIEDLCKILKAQQTRILLICSTDDNPLKSYANDILCQ